jgi:hypothetical protein
MHNLKLAIALLGFFVGALLGGCQKPKVTDLIGTWVSADGATLALERDGKFSGRGLPARVFLMHDSIDSPINGKGQWKLEAGDAYWEVQLSFDEISGQPSSTGANVLVSGTGKSIGLYQWTGEEGGERYELTKK